jgi:N-formylglutamate amidohydrolase
VLSPRTPTLLLTEPTIWRKLLARTRRFNERRRERNRELWRVYHSERAECLERTAAELGASPRSKAEAFLRSRGSGLVR